MVIIRINANVEPVQAELVAKSILRQAKTGTIVLPHFCELLNEVPADEEIKIITNQDARQTGQRESDCETCGKGGTCYHNHGRRGVVRINCPLWRPKA